MKNINNKKNKPSSSDKKGDLLILVDDLRIKKIDRAIIIIIDDKNKNLNLTFLPYMVI